MDDTTVLVAIIGAVVTILGVLITYLLNEKQRRKSALADKLWELKYAAFAEAEVALDDLIQCGAISEGLRGKLENPKEWLARLSALETIDPSVLETLTPEYLDEVIKGDNETTMRDLDFRTKLAIIIKAAKSDRKLSECQAKLRPIIKNTQIIEFIMEASSAADHAIALMWDKTADRKSIEDAKEELFKVGIKFRTAMIAELEATRIGD